MDIVVVVHDASRTGAPLSALRWLRWLEPNRSIRSSVWLLRGGPLTADFGEAAPTVLLDGATTVSLRRLTDLQAALAMATTPILRALAARRGATQPSVVVANSLASWSAASQLAPRARLVCWVHELDHTASRIVEPNSRQRLIDATDHFVAAGPRVGAMLSERWHISTERITVVDSFVDEPTKTTPTPRTHRVLGVGSLTARKGPDAFVGVLAQLARRHPAIQAIWVGGDPTSPIGQLVRADIAQAGLDGQLRLVPEVSSLDAWWPNDGVLLHTAREDPDPLAVLEAAARGIPVVTWDTGGGADLVRASGCADLVAEPGDQLGLAARAALLLEDEPRRRHAGLALRAAASARRTSVAGPRLLAAALGAPQ